MTEASTNYWHIAGAIFGIVISFFPFLIRKKFASSAEILETTDLAMLGAAFISIYSALWWVINAVTLDPFSNTMAATYAASAALFTSASFRLKGVEGQTNPKADVARIESAYHVAKWLPVLLLALMIIQSVW